MLSSLSSIVRTFRYIRSPCIFLFPGGGFQLLMLSTFRHRIGCNDTTSSHYNWRRAWFHGFNHILHVQKADLTFLSSLKGCSGVSGWSLELGKTYSGGLRSTDSFTEARWPPSLKISENGKVRLEGWLTHIIDKIWCEEIKKKLHLCLFGCKSWDTTENCRWLHCTHLQGRGSSEDPVDV